VSKNISLTLQVWRQKNADDTGRFEEYTARDISADMSFLEMLDVVNENLTAEGNEPIAFEHDCREGICGTCGAMVNGQAHGPERGTTLCQLHMRHFKDGDTLVIEPWRSRAFKVIKDLVVDRSPMDTIMQAGGFISAKTGGAPDGNAIPINEETAKGDGRRCLHRLWRLYRQLPERVGNAFRQCEDLPSGIASAGTPRGGDPGHRHG